VRGHSRNRNLGIYRVPLLSQAHQGTSLFTSVGMNQRGCLKGSLKGNLRSDFQRVRGDRTTVRGQSSC